MTFNPFFEGFDDGPVFLMLPRIERNHHLREVWVTGESGLIAEELHGLTARPGNVTLKNRPQWTALPL